MSSIAIDARDVTKVYRKFAHRKQFATIKSALLSGSLVRDLRPDETFAALKGVSFQVPAGCTYGIIGRNGSGKSTMLKCVAGISRPTTGSVTVNGRISALIELGAGFHPEISGRENVFINGIMLGLTRKEIARRFDEIVEFAELEDFIDAPVKTYSSGMYMRLGFAVAIHVDPDVLLVDEVLAVGDEGFTHKCLDKFGEFRRRGQDRAARHALAGAGGALLRRGALDRRRARTRARRPAPRRRRLHHRRREERGAGPGGGRCQGAGTRRGRAASPNRPSPIPSTAAETPDDGFKASEGRWGSREVEITGVSLIGEDGQPGHVFHSGEAVTIELGVAGPAPRHGLRLRHRALQRRRRLLLRHQHRRRGPEVGRAVGQRHRAVRHREPRPGRGHLQARRRGPQAGRLRLRLSPPALHVPREVAHEGRRHLPPASSVGVLAFGPPDAGRRLRR